jgi:hypothetical protein
MLILPMLEGPDRIRTYDEPVCHRAGRPIGHGPERQAGGGFAETLRGEQLLIRLDAGAPEYGPIEPQGESRVGRAGRQVEHRSVSGDARARGAGTAGRRSRNARGGRANRSRRTRRSGTAASARWPIRWRIRRPCLGRGGRRTGACRSRRTSASPVARRCRAASARDPPTRRGACRNRHESSSRPAGPSVRS